MSKRYRAVVFHPGPRTRWRTARNFSKADPKKVPVITEGFEPDPAEIIIEREFRSMVVASAWARVQLRRLKNVCAEIYDKTSIDG